eukprot:TRINITY_DN21410_c0_g1_i1.p1 TRINITY_DN21410_c0_g1~~TRINITY_DN21410_c0_g1_i1.p1  ORF type:complete len:488 (-),score=31.36 TRINITY_DN21410_c0_g1_i1:235-1662(-)
MVSNERWATVVATLAALSCLLFSGIVFGWAPIQLLLEDDAVYSSLCSAQEPLCAARVSRLILMYTVGSTGAVIGGAPCGFMVDVIGPLFCSLMSGVVVTAGIVLVALSDEHTFDGFLIGSFLIGFGGAFVLMSSFPVAFILPKSWRTFYLSCINCFFDASSLVGLLLYQTYKQTNLGRQGVLGGLGVLCALLHILLFLGWSRGPATQLNAVKAAELMNERQPEQKPESKAADPASAVEFSIDEANKSKALDSEQVDVTLESAAVERVEAKTPPLHGLSLLKQFASFEFLFVLVYFPINLVRSNTYLGTNKELLQTLGDEEYGYLFTQIFVASLPASTVFLPFISLCLSRRGFGDTLVLFSCLSVAWNVVALTGGLFWQLLAFAAFTNARAMLYCAHFVFIAHAFGSRTSGRIQGVLAIIAGVGNFLIWPFTTWLERQGLPYLYGGLLVLTLPSLTVVALLRRYLSRTPAADCRNV